MSNPGIKVDCFGCLHSECFDQNLVPSAHRISLLFHFFFSFLAENSQESEYKFYGNYQAEAWQISLTNTAQ